MNKVNKQELLSQLNNAQNNFMLGIAALGLLVQEESHSVMEKLVCIITETSFSFVNDVSQVRSQFHSNQFPIKFSSFPLSVAANYIKIANKERIQEIQQEFFKMLLRSLLKESFEVIKEYCTNSNQLPLFRKQDWYHFARFVRNCLSHNFLIEYRDFDKKLLPVSWKGRSFTLCMNGKPIDASFLTIDHALELYKDMRGFVENSL
ncbi:MAG: hypothetical protein KME45_18335 [Stenomitos rutilans HA7619-LM2]|jgi:hypothetical protein|nr:hypothetical protein [Stenomitos rutilans HA7619-LM2]